MNTQQIYAEPDLKSAPSVREYPVLQNFVLGRRMLEFRWQEFRFKPTHLAEVGAIETALVSEHASSHEDAFGVCK